MYKKRKIVILIIGGIALLLLVKVILDAPYRNHIPPLPDLQAFTPTLRDQLTAASRKAYLNPTAENLGMLGMVYHSGANYEKAAECYKLAIKKDNSEWIWNYYLGYLNREMVESNAAIENFNAVIAKNPKAYQASYYVGEEYQNTGNNQQAEKAFSRITDLKIQISAIKTETRYDYFPLETYANFQLARIYLGTNRVDEAETTLKEILKNNRSFGPAYRLLGNVYRTKGDTILSKLFTVRANDMAVYSSPIDTLVDRLVLMSRSELYLLKKIDEAEKSVYPEWAMRLVNNALQYFPENKYLISKAIHIYIMMDKVTQAIPYMDQHIKAYQNDFVEMKSVGDLYYQKGFYPQSVIYYSKAAILKPEDPDVQFCLVLCLWKEGLRQEAIGKFDELIEKNGKNVKILADGASMLLYLGEKEKAIVFLHRLMQLAPSDPKAQKIAGKIAESDGNLPEAVKLYEATFRGDQEDLSTIRSLGNILMKLKMWDKSITLFRKALDYHPNDSYFLERLGTLLVSCPDPKLRNINEGLEFSERAFINTTSHSSTLISAGRSLAVAYATLGDKQNAYLIMNMTINAARRENLSESNIEGLKKLLMQFRP
ncbi:MAG: tetratricopeptide repeat protein [Bacteroidia bacterium]|nr:tetratricopeptide repeat protein [Bacteroidia bacterium]